MSGRHYDVITFDCYGTLIDWRGGIRAALAEAAARAGVALDPDAALEHYMEIEPTVESSTYQSYRGVIAETARRVGARVGWTLTDEAAAGVASSLPAWPAFPDTNAALERLVGAGHGLAILSNTDDDLIAASRKHLTVPFEFVITAQQVRAYKPAHAHWERARPRVGGRRWLHAAQSYFHDVEPATALGIPMAWINRHGQPTPRGGPSPDREFDNLSELADWLA